jgi:PRTRC genetic system protein C
MALEVTNLEREFTFKKNGANVTLADPNPDLSTQEVMQHYGSQYPELTTASVEGPRVEGTKAIYSVKTSIGTKG